MSASFAFGPPTACNLLGDYIPGPDVTQYLGFLFDNYSPYTCDSRQLDICTDGRDNEQDTGRSNWESGLIDCQDPACRDVCTNCTF